MRANHTNNGNNIKMKYTTVLMFTNTEFTFTGRHLHSSENRAQHVQSIVVNLHRGRGVGTYCNRHLYRSLNETGWLVTNRVRLRFNPSLYLFAFELC